MHLNDISGQVVDAAMKVHSEFGPGLFERVYQACLKHELRKRGLKVLAEVEMPIRYDNITLEVGYRLDLLVEDEVIVEIKALNELAPVHRSQLFTYLKLSCLPIGLLINFGERHLKNGIQRIAN